MKKIYLSLLTISLCFISFGQSPIVTIDRANITGPTATGTVSNISATGFTRGSGITSSNGGNDFSTKTWDSNTQLNAANTNEHIEWSVTADANYDIDINSLNIKVLRNNNGPQNWQIFYSLDGFTTPGLSISAAFLASTAETNYVITNLLINSGDGGTVTFRLYAWGANNNGGSFTIAGEPAWSNFGITDPGVSLTGTLNSAPLNSTESNIVITGFNPTDNINYLPYTVISGLTTANALKIGEFSIQDGGDDFTDADLLPTILTDISFDISGFNNIAALGIFDGAMNVAETSSLGPNTVFSSINSGSGISAPDNGSKTFSVYATFNPFATDNDQIQLIVATANANGILGSSFENVNAGGASTPIDGDDNRIEVTATRLEFGIQPTDVGVLSIMTPAPTVLATDINSSIDLDYAETIAISSTSATFDPSATLSVNAVSGIATFDNVIFSSTSNNETLLGFSLDGLFPATSNIFEVFGLTVTIASQDFDGSAPDWPYTTNIPFYDSGWGIGGYYGIIDSGLASPLDYGSFSNNILGSNDLKRNGTAGLATITFNTLDISSFNGVSLTFDYDISGFGNNDDAHYEVFFDGTTQGIVDLVNGDGTISIAIPDNVSTLSLQVSVGSNGNTAFTGFDNFLVSATFDGLIYFSDSWSPSAPTNGTGSINALIIDGTYTINSDVAVNNIFVADLGTIIIEEGKSLQVNGNLFCNNNVFLDSNSIIYSSLIVEGTIYGNITYSRHVNTNAASGGNDLISAPVTGQTFGDFALANTNIVSNPSNPTEKLFGIFEKVNGSYVTYDTNVPAEAAVTLDPGIGYRAASTDGLNFSFNGTVNTGSIAVPIIISGTNSPEWNLVGNPYPSYITLSDFLAANNSQFAIVSSGIYGYDGDASDGWDIWNQAYSDANPDAVITPGQGFLVSSAAASGTISFTSSMRTTGNSDDFIPGRSSNISSISHIKLLLSGANKSYKSDFYFTDNASLGLDPGYDSEIFGGSAPEFSIYSHLVNDNVGNDFAIQSLGYNDLTDVTVPLGINVTQGEEVTIRISSSTLPISTYVYLEDNIENTLTLLTENDYTFAASSNISSTGRFFLRFTSSSLSIGKETFNDLQVYATSNPKILHVNGNLSGTTNLKLFDLQGRLVKSSLLEVSSNKNQIDISNLTTGIYVVSLSNNSLTKTKKIIIR